MQLSIGNKVEREAPPVRERLEACLRQAEEKLQQLDERVHDKPDLGPGKGSAVGYSWEMALARRRTVMARIEALREALARVREGTYGRCKRCGVQIDAERLEILPTATLCVACAQSARARTTSTRAMGTRATFQKR